MEFEVCGEPVYGPEYEVQLYPVDIIVETFTPGDYMKLRHIPTGIYVEGEGKLKFRLYEKLLKELEDKVKKSE